MIMNSLFILIGVLKANDYGCLNVANIKMSLYALYLFYIKFYIDYIFHFYVICFIIYLLCIYMYIRYVF